MYIDAHSHWSDSRYLGFDLKQLLQKSIDHQISLFLQGGVHPLDWENQKKIKQQFPENFLLAFGLHPYFIAENKWDDCEFAMDQLAQQISECQGLGEAGLDFREQYISHQLMGDMELQKHKQMTFFENQIELSKLTNKPMILHIVKAHSEALKILKVWEPPSAGGFVHGFNGSFEAAQEYIDLNFLISVGGAVTYEKNIKLRNALLQIPLSKLLIESDSPDQAPLGWSGLNDSSSLLQIATEIAKIKQTTATKILEITTENFKRLFKL